MPIDENDLSEAEKLGKIQQEVHTLTANNNKLFTLFDKLSDKIESLIKAMHPKPMNIATIIASGAAFIVIIGGLLGVVIWVVNSSNAPMVAQMNQISVILQTMNTNTNQNTNLIQITNKDVSGIREETKNNAETLQWLLFDENLPKQVTILQEQVRFLKLRK